MASVSGNVRLIDTKCRICMFPKQNLSSLFNRGLSMKVMKLAEIKMYEGDGLPSTICLDCELEVNRCVNFIGQIQRADVKLRQMLQRESELPEVYKRVQELGKEEHEMEEREHYMEEREEEMEEREQEASTSQIDIEEFNVKQEITTMDHYLDEGTDPKRESDSDNHFEDESLPLQDESLALQDESLALQPFTNNYQPEDERVLNPLNHVDVMEDGNRPESMEVHHDPLGQEEPLIEPQKIESFPFVDPLTFMKQEEGVSMDIDKNNPEPCASSSTVKTTGISFPTVNRSDWKTQQQITSNYLIPIANSTDPLTGGELSNIPAKLVTTKILKKQNMYEEYITKKNESQSFCLVCEIDCGSYDLLKEHEKNEGFICRICTLEIKSHTDLEVHFFSHKPWKCSTCQDFFISVRDLLIHRKKDHPTIGFSCEICGRKYSQRKTLRQHKLEIHSTNLVYYDNKCVVCGKKFRYRSQFQFHLTNAHIVYEFVKCKFCKSLCEGPEKLKSHIRRNHLQNRPVTCKMCHKVFVNDKSLFHHILTHDDTESVCEICGLSVKGKSVMRNHMRRFHSQKGTFFCKFCNIKFELKYELKRHYDKCTQNKRSDPDPVCCEICGKQYKNLGILKRHKIIHSDDRAYKCEECGATFKKDVTLMTHRRVHSNVGKYCCDGCGRTFRWKPTLVKHVNKCTNKSE